MHRVWGAVDDTPLPMDCRAYLKKDCRMPLPPPPPPPPPAVAPLFPPLAAQGIPALSTAQLCPDADAEMTPCEPVEPAPASIAAPAPAPTLVPAPFIRPRYKTAIPLSRRILRRAFGATTWERSEKLRLARMAEQGAFTFPTAFDPLAFDSLVAHLPTHPPSTTSTSTTMTPASQNAVLAKLASLGEFKAGSGVEFCGGATFWEGEDGEEMELEMDIEMEMCDDDEFTGMFEDTEWGADEGDFEPIDEGDLTAEWEDAHRREHPEPVGAGGHVDVRVLFDEETEIVRSLGEIRAAAAASSSSPSSWSPPAPAPVPMPASLPVPVPMTRPRTRSGGRCSDLQRMEEDERRDSLVETVLAADGEEDDIFRYRPLEEGEVDQWRATHAHARHPRPSQDLLLFGNGVDAEEEFFDPDPQLKEEREREREEQVPIESPVEIYSHAHSHPQVVLKEIPASPMVECFPQNVTASSFLVQSLEEQIERMDTQQNRSLSPSPSSSPRPPVLLAPAPKHAWAFSSIKNALSSSVSSLVQIARYV
jgi:hypothetical protein